MYFNGFNLRSSRFFQRLCLGFFQIFLGLMARVWMDGFLGINDHFCVLFGLFYLSEVVEYFAY